MTTEQVMKDKKVSGKVGFSRHCLDLASMLALPGLG